MARPLLHRFRLAYWSASADAKHQEIVYAPTQRNGSRAIVFDSEQRVDLPVFPAPPCAVHIGPMPRCRLPLPDDANDPNDAIGQLRSGSEGTGPGHGERASAFFRNCAPDRAPTGVDWRNLPTTCTPDKRGHQHQEIYRQQPHSNTHQPLPPIPTNCTARRTWCPRRWTSQPTRRRMS